RLDLVAQEEDRDAEQDHRGPGHPHQEDVRVGRDIGQSRARTAAAVMPARMNQIGVIGPYRSDRTWARAPGYGRASARTIPGFGDTVSRESRPKIKSAPPAGATGRDCRAGSKRFRLDLL
ncbi:hypothetical protein, partial [Methylobacterium symbioticum]|uniref:hypothetical protein n=1 Tax=Methylobacterium symbioticum TaxID=2584084 RepID=UPI001AED4B67